MSLNGPSSTVRCTAFVPKMVGIDVSPHVECLLNVRLHTILLTAGETKGIEHQVERRMDDVDRLHIV
jgi:hypothetical protein